MKSTILVALGLTLSLMACGQKIKNAKTETVKIYGNCGMCENNIETAGLDKKVSMVDWNKDTKMATITYDATQTNTSNILKKVALAGYDSDEFLAPDDTYGKLHECCQYERASKPKTNEGANAKANSTDERIQNTAADNELKSVVSSYFGIKDALVKTDGKAASTKAREMIAALNAVKMDKLSETEHTAWMAVMKDLAFDAGHIEETTEASHQRDHFNALSKNIYTLIKATKNEAPVYYQKCPMANNGKGANWLSMENAIKNPYYGSQMLSCGSTIETIK